MKETIYIRLEDAQRAVKTYAVENIKSGRYMVDAVDMSAHLVHALEALPQERKLEKRELDPEELQAVRDMIGGGGNA